MEKKEVDFMIDLADKMNPYPVDIFPEPEEKDWKDVGKFLLENGYNPDRIFAKWGRMVWNNCVSCTKDLIEDEND